MFYWIFTYLNLFPLGLGLGLGFSSTLFSTDCCALFRWGILVHIVFCIVHCLKSDSDQITYIHFIFQLAPNQL